MRSKSYKLLTLLTALILGFGQMWAAASSVIPATPDYKDISTVATAGTYTFTCSSANITGAASATSSWIGWYSTQSSFKEYDKSGSATCMGTQTKIPNLKYDKVYFYVTNCTSFEVQAWGNGDNRHVNYSYQATDAASPTADSFTSANNTTCASSGEISLNASKSYTIIVWNDASEEIGVTYMVFNTGSSGPVDPTLTYNDGAYTIGSSALDLNSLIASQNSDGDISYAIKTDPTGDAYIDNGHEFISGLTGTVVITATQEATASYNAISVDFNVVVSEPVTPECPDGNIVTGWEELDQGQPIELTATLTSGNGDITYTWYKSATNDLDAAKAGGAIATGNVYSKAHCELGDEGFYFCVATKDACSDAVSNAFEIIAVHPVVACDTYLHFVATADATANGKTNWDGFTNAVTGSNNQSSSVTIDGTTYTLTKRTGSTGGGGTILGFTIPANKAGTLYGYMKSSGSAARVLSLKKGDDVVMTNNEITDGNWTLITMSNIAPGTYTLSPDQNVQVQMFALKICDATFHTITLDLNGGTGATSMQALDGVAATKPADPTKEHCAFAGWYNGGSAYDWSTAVTAPLTLTAHWTQLYTISFANGGGSGDAPAAIADKAEGETFEVPANTFTAPSASQEFDKWNDGTNDYLPGATYTVGTENVVLTAQWKALVAKYTVIFKDGDATIDTKLFDVGSNPSDAGVDKTKALNTFAAWQKDAADIALDDAFWATVAADATVTLTARWAKAYANNVDFEAYILANTGEKDDADKAEAYVIAQNYALSTKTNTTFDANNSSNNGAYAGLKIKNSGTTLSWNVAADKVVEFKAGVMVANGSLSINGGAATTIDGGSTSSGDNFKKHYFYSAAEALYVFTTSNGSAEVIKAITMRDPYTVSFEAHGDADPSALPGTPSVTLPAAANGSQNFAGWYDAETGGNLIGMNGDTYTPTANITLHAQWEALSTVNTLSDLQVNGVTVDGFDPDVHTYNIVVPYGTAVADLPKITLATPTNSNANVALYPTTGPAWTDDFGGCYRQQAEVTPQDPTAAHGYNDIRITIAPKDGVSIIKVATTGGTNKTVTGLYAGEGDVNLSSNMKMDNGKYIGFTLDGTTLQAGDRINVHTTEAANTGGSHIIFYDNMTDKNELYETGEIGGAGDNIFTINAAMVGSATAYVYRANNDAAHQWNGKIDFIEVTRAMNPVLTAITINGEAGVINEALKTVAVELQPGYDLAALTIVPTIVSNTAEADVVKTVESNSGNWIIGDNTYRLTDKDGDYTEYTVTLSVGDVKHTVSFNTHGGSAVASVEVVEGEKLAAAPADPTKDDYIFQGWAETADGAVVDVTTFTISADKEFHAIWVADGAIKLLDGSTVNHTNFITGVTADETVEFQGNTVNYAKFSGTVSGVNSVKDLTRVIAYNATTNKTKIRISAHNNSTSARSILVKGLVEGASAAVDLATIALGNKEDKVSDWIEFDNAANRTIYIMVSSSAGDVYFTQVKVIESGETPMKHAGETGYSLNLNKGRFFGLASTDLAFEGLNARLSGDYTALNSGYAKLTETSMSFTVASAMTLSVTTNNNKTYYVTKGAAGTDNETAKTGVSEFNLTAGTWYITGGTAEVQITNIAFTAPKCAEPSFAALANSDVCEGSGYEALNGTATVSDGGTPTYQWYREDDSAIDGATEATYTPSADGKYYVIAVNHLAGYADNEKKSALVTVTTHAGTVITEELANQRGNVDDVVTLEVVASGKNLHYAWKESATIDGTYTDVAGAADAASLNVTITAGMDKYYKVVVTGDCGTPQESTAHVTQFVAVAQANVTGSIAWNWANAASVNEIKLTASTTPKKNEGFVMANGDAAIYNNANFESDKLYLEGEYIVRDGKYFQGQTIKFNTTVAGAVRVKFSHTGNSKPARELYINGVGTGDSRTSATAAWSRYVEVPAGEVVITAYHVDPADGAGQQYIRVPEIEFFALDVVRDDDWIAPGELGTVCYPNGYVVFGAEMYEMAGTDDNGKFVFDEVTVLTPGKPYMFRATVTYPETIKFYKTLADAASEAGTSNGMIGTFSSIDLAYTDARAAKWYYFSGTKFWAVSKRTSDLNVPANRCYVDLNTPHPASAPRQDVRRITFDVQGENAATGIDQITNEQSQMTNKVIINGHLYILRGEKLYNANGQLVK